MCIQSAYSKTNKPSIMKVLKVLAIVLVVLIGLYVVFAAVSPSELQVEKTEIINAPASAVMANVVCLDKWPTWSAWQKMDPEMKNEYSENPCGAGAWNSWDGPNSGKGKQTIDEVNGEEAIKMSLVFEGFDGTNYANWKFEEEDGVTTVTWTFEGASSPFMMRPMNVVMKGVLEESYQTGLAALKEVSEANPAASSGYSIEEIDLPGRGVLFVSDNVEPGNVERFCDSSFNYIMKYMSDNGIEMAGQPCRLFYSWSDTLVNVSAAIPVADEVDGDTDVAYRFLDEMSALSVDCREPFTVSGNVHRAITNYSTENAIMINSPVIEICITDRTEQQDKGKWITRIIYPVKEQ